MAASLLSPTAVLDRGVHLHEHGHGHPSPGRKSTTKRFPLPSTSINGGHSQTTPLKSYAFSHSISSDLSNSSAAAIQDQPDSGLPLPQPELYFPTSTGRPNSMERRRSVGLPTHLRLGSNGYEIPAASGQKYASANDGATRKWTTVTEIISSLIVPLPYLLITLALGTYSVRDTLKQPRITPKDESTVSGSPTRNSRSSIRNGEFAIACALTSVTLLLMGCIGKIGGAPKLRDRRKPSFGNSDSAAPRSGQVILLRSRQILSRILGVALPFYASIKLGGDRVSLVMLVALAADIFRVEDGSMELKTLKGWRRLLTHRRWTLASIFLQVIYDLVVSSSYARAWEVCVGYIALSLSIFFIPPPFPSFKPRGATTSSASTSSAPSISRVLATQWEARTMARPVSDIPSTTSPLICTSQDIDLTLAAGTITGAFGCIMLLFSTTSLGVLSLTSIGINLLSSCATALSFFTVQAHSMRQNRGFGLLLGSLSALVLAAVARGDVWSSIIFQGVFIGISFTAMASDTHLLVSASARSEHSHHHSITVQQPSRFSGLLIQSFQHWPLLHSILVEKDSRRIFYFMSLNFAFMLVQTFYGIATGSLGLLSDSIHMFFDCLALVVGLCAAVMSKWPPSIRFPYGYGKMDTLAGFANGIFLMLISIEIVYEAIERLSEGSQMQRIGELLTVSSLGLVVNLVGITAFGHAHHGHSHGSHDHSDHSHQSHPGHDHSAHTHPQQGEHHHSGHSGHSHPHGGHKHETAQIHHAHPHHGEKPGHSHSHDHRYTLPTPPIPNPLSQSLQSQSHAHAHKHHHGNENMHGIYLHILADTLGSVAVVVSTLLIHFFGWSGFDPLASCLIAILIFASAIPLVLSSAKTLLLTIPEDTEFDLRDALAGVSGLRGVVGYAVPKFWLEEGDEKRVLGVIHVVAAKGSDLEDVKERTLGFFRGRNMDVLVQVERDGSNTCWCRGGAKVG